MIRLFDSVFWFQDTLVLGKNTEFIELEKGLYSVVGYDSNGCQIQSSFEIQEGLGELVVPNIFTPNGDNLNDEFLLTSYSCIQEFEITIFNRWGRAVFESNDKNFVWKGEHNSDGIYYYQIKLTNQNEESKSLKGWIQLSR